MRQRLPSLTALRAFEAAARHGSFSRAAAELCVSQAAVSHQIKQLEEHLGVQLFVRMGRTPELTSAGQTLLPEITQAFDQIDLATSAVAVNDKAKRLLIRAVPFLAAQWLMSRLKEYRKSYLDIELHFHHSYGLPDFRREEVNLAILWVRRLERRRCLPAYYTLICSPRLLRGKHPIKTLGDINHHELLHISDYTIWERWVHAASAPIADVHRGLLSDDQNTLTRSLSD